MALHTRPPVGGRVEEPGSDACGADVRPSPSRLRVTVASVGLAALLVAVLGATLTPTPLDRGLEPTVTSVLEALHRHGVPEWFGYRKLEFTANVVMFIPLGFLLALLLPHRRQGFALVMIPALSGLIELMQAILLPERLGSFWDVLANSIGGWLGAMAAVALRAAVHARDDRVVAAAQWEVRQPR